MSGFYDIPPGHSVGSSLYTVFTHYASPWLSEIAASGNADTNEYAIDGASFNRLCKDMPSMMESSTNPYGLRRRDLDLIFSKCCPIGSRRLSFVHFLEALKLIGMTLNRNDDPTNAFTKLMVEHIFGAFDHNSIEPNPMVYEKILNELSTTSSPNLNSY